MEEKRDDELTDELFELFDETDENLIGLSPSELEEKLRLRAKKEQAERKERDRLLNEARSLLKEGDRQKAESFYRQALVFDPSCEEAFWGVWGCRTQNFSDLSPFYTLEGAEEIESAAEPLRRRLVERVKAELLEEKERLEREEAPLLKKFRAEQNTRETAFRSNRNYYLLRFSVLLGGFLLFALCSGISAYFIVRTKSILPIVLSAVFGGIALFFAILFAIFSRKLVVAERLLKENERLSSTDEGQRIQEIEEKLEALGRILS